MITRVSIRDFKSIRSQDVELGPLTVLVGRSGTGKSNFTQAIRFLRNYLLNPEEAVKTEGGWERIVPAGMEQPATAIGLQFSLPPHSKKFEYRLGFWTNNQRFPEQTRQLHLNYEALLQDGKQLFEWKIKPNNHKQLSPQWTTPPSLAVAPQPNGQIWVNRLPAIQEVADAYAALSTSIGYYAFSNDVLSEPKRSNNEQRHSRSGLHDDGSNYLSTMLEISQDFRFPQARENLTAILQKLNPSVTGINVNSITNPSEAIVGHSAKDKVLALKLDQESDGFRRFYGHLLALYQIPPKLTNVFEEPENGIYPGALELLAEEFKSAEPSGRGQVILTTHSPGLLEHVDVDCVRVFEMRGGETAIGKVAQSQSDAVKDQLLTCGELLTVDPARLNDPQPIAEGTGA